MRVSPSFSASPLSILRRTAGSARLILGQCVGMVMGGGRTTASTIGNQVKEPLVADRTLHANEALRRLLEHCPKLDRTHDLVRQFASMLDARDAAPLPDWLDHLTASRLPALDGSAKAIREDQHAVVQGITTPLAPASNEGRITDLKLQKRIMAGRAGVPLLRNRVILMAGLRRSYP
ncbi:hypothetical protein [Streptomyces sp. NPDC001815]|uniref:hypothetical protein n=1 Tax=Streptomyces sp. NPDC001815 TaxID=3154526 RepID=UPI00331DC952